MSMFIEMFPKGAFFLFGFSKCSFFAAGDDVLSIRSTLRIQNMYREETDKFWKPSSKKQGGGWMVF